MASTRLVCHDPRDKVFDREGSQFTFFSVADTHGTVFDVSVPDNEHIGDFVPLVLANLLTKSFASVIDFDAA